MKKRYIGAVAIVLFFAVLLLGGYFALRTQTFMETLGEKAGQYAESTLGVPVSIGKIVVVSPGIVELENIGVEDADGKELLTAERVTVEASLLAAVKSGADAISTVRVSGIRAQLREREDGRWNIEDVSSSSTSPSFHGTVEVTDAEVTVTRATGEAATLVKGEATLDFAHAPAVTAKGSGEVLGASVQGEGTYRKERQTFDVTAKAVTVESLLPYLPAGLLPEGVALQSGEIPEARLVGSCYGSVLTLTGDATLAEGKLEVLGTTVEHVEGSAHFTEKEALITGDAEAAGQKAHVSGIVYYMDGTPYLDITAQSDSFDPSKLRTDIPYRGAAAVKAHITGTMADPTVEGTARVESGEAYGIAFQKARATIRYEGGRLFVKNAYAEALGGRVSGEAAFLPKDLTYTGHVKVQQVDAQAIAALCPEAVGLSGRISADLGFSGKGQDAKALEAYGSVSHRGGAYGALPLERVNASFALKHGNLTIDYASARLPNNTSVGLEGEIRDIFDSPELGLALYGSHVDFSLLQKLTAQAEVTGTGDFSIQATGQVTNPYVDVNLVSMHGKLLKQPYDDLRIHAAGSLDGVEIREFSLMKDGKQRWYVEGSLGFSGEKKLDVRADTVGVRAEDLAALIAPDQNITGNVDNTIRLTGTMDDPRGVGYIHFYRGSYNGMLLQGMDGDYFLDEKGIRLQDFHILSPRIDVDVNGYVTKSHGLDLIANVHEIDFARFFLHAPYPISGKGTFEGKVGGTVESPTFSGVLKAPELVANEVAFTDIAGQVEYQGSVAYLRNFSLQQGTGKLTCTGFYNTATEATSGQVDAEHVDISSLAALLNQKTDKLSGIATVKADLSGTAKKPTVEATGSLATGSISGYPIHDGRFSISLKDRVVTVDTLSLLQGDSGELHGDGTITLDRGLDGQLSAMDGTVDGQLTAHGIPLGLFTKSLGLDAEVSGNVETHVELGGTLKNPAADMTLTVAEGGAYGATFDTLSGTLHLKDGRVKVDALKAMKTVGDKSFEASAKGVVPLRALTAEKGETLAGHEQIALTLNLDKANLALLPTLSPQVDWAMGDLAGNLQFTGTAAQPQINGSLSLKDGSAKLKPLEIPLTEMNSRIDFRGNTMTIMDFSGKMGDGTYQLIGGVTLDGRDLGDINLSLVAKGLDVRSSFFTGPLDATVAISEEELYGMRLPKLTGTLDLHDCVISMPAIPDTEEELPVLALDTTVNAGKKVHGYSPALYDMYLEGSMHYGGTTRHPLPSGTISVKRGGTLRYLKNVFDIYEGVLSFNQVDSFLPSIQFAAGTRLTRTRVFLTLMGPVGAMDMRLTSSPEMSQTDIMKLLMMRGDYRTGEASWDMSSLLLTGLQMSFLSEVENSVRDALQLDRFTIGMGNGSLLKDTSEEEASQTDRDVYHLEFGKYVGHNVMLRYSQSIVGDSVSRVGVQYDINERYTVSYDQQGGDSIIGFSANVRF